MVNNPLMKQIFKCLKVKILYTINVSFCATDTAKASNSPERFLYTNNFYIIPDPDFYFQRGQRLNQNCPFNGFLLLILQWQLRHAQYWRGWSSGCQSSFFSEHQGQPVTAYSWWDAENIGATFILYFDPCFQRYSSQIYTLLGWHQDL